MPDQEKPRSEVEVLKEMLDHQRRTIDNAFAANSHLNGELIFWKKLALSQLGVDSQKVNELVHMGGLGMVGAPTTALRGR